MTFAESDKDPLQAIRVAVEHVVDRMAGSRIASVAAIVIVALACFLPGFGTIPAIDRDESYFAEAVKHMVATGDYLTIPEANRFEPIGLYWLQVGAVWLTGASNDPPISVFRLPSLIAAIAAAILTWWMTLAFGRPRAALIAGLFMAANMILAGEARLARADAVLLATIVLAEGALARIWQSPNDGRTPLLALLFWVALGLGVLAKGAIAPVILAVAIVILCFARGSIAWLKRLEPLPGLIVFAVILFPWITAMILGGGGAAAHRELFGELDFHAPPGTYLLLFFAIFWPGAAFFLVSVPAMVDRLRRPPVLFAIAVAVPLWLVLELYPTKFAPYALPAFPALALLAGIAVDKGWLTAKAWTRWLLSLGLLLWPAVVAIGVPVGLYLIDEPIPLGALPPLILAAVIGAIAWHWLRSGSAVAAAAASVVAAVSMYLGLYGFVVPGLEKVHLGRSLAVAVERAVSCSPPQFVAAGFTERSLAFNHIEARFVDGAGAADFLNEGGCRIAVVESRQLASFRQRAEDLGLELASKGRVQGFNLGNGRWVMLRFFTTSEVPMPLGPPG